MNTSKGPNWNASDSNLSLLKRSVHFLFAKFIRPRESDPDLQRKEFIFNVIVAGSIILLLIANGMVAYRLLNGAQFVGMTVMIPLLILAVFIILLTLSRLGYAWFASLIFLGIYIFGVSYSIFNWGADLPQAILSYAVIIIMAGILFNSWSGFATAAAIVVILLVIGSMQLSGTIEPKLYWKTTSFALGDIILFCVTYFLIMLVSWLSNREIEKSLQRARSSELALKQERDQLEIKVEERTRELRQMELQKISELSEFAEFGRLAGGFFHDLINPLNALLLNIKQLKDSKVSAVSAEIDRSFAASKRMEEFMLKIRKQLQREDSRETFFLERELREVLHLLGYKGREAGVRIDVSSGQSIQYHGSPLKFRQLAMNLICNAIESYADQNASGDKKVTVDLRMTAEVIALTVTDSGAGIPAERMANIFEPFYSTKKTEHGIGIGLSTVKNIVDRDLHGTITVKSAPGAGSTFTVTWQQQASASPDGHD